MTPRKKLLAANWKMNLERKDVSIYFDQFAKNYDPSEKVDLLFAGSYLLLETMICTMPKGLSADNVRVAAQNVHFEGHGAFTGEISWLMLAEVGVAEAIIGHSERRQFFGETDETIAKKMQTAKRLQKRSILCVGENLNQRKAGQTFDVLIKQLHSNLSLVTDLNDIVIAYEPVWAIGTGLSASPEQAQEVHSMIREELKTNFNQDAADSILILYGGSMNLANVGELCSQKDIDGGLVGGASLKPLEFQKMYAAVAEL